MKHTIYIVIPIHNRLSATKSCLESLLIQTYPHFKIVIVDDGSTDGSSQHIHEKYPDVVLLKGDGQLWWTGATNVGVEYALTVATKHDYILTLNNDTVVPANYLETLMSLALQAPNALIGSIAKDLNVKTKTIDTGVRIKWFSAKFSKVGAKECNSQCSFYPVSVLPGRGTLIPTRAFREIGLFDQVRFPHYAADYDFALRAAANGYRLLLHPSCFLYSDTRLTGISNTHNEISFGMWLESFKSVRSPNNLKIRWRFAIRHPPLYCRPTFLLFDLARVIFGSLRNQVANKLNRAIFSRKQLQNTGR